MNFMRLLMKDMRPIDRSRRERLSQASVRLASTPLTDRWLAMCEAPRGASDQVFCGVAELCTYSHHNGWLGCGYSLDLCWITPVDLHCSQDKLLW